MYCVDHTSSNFNFMVIVFLFCVSMKKFDLWQCKFRWDTKEMEQLPDYMRVCYLALINTTNEVAHEVVKKHGINVLPHLTKSVRFII